MVGEDLRDDDRNTLAGGNVQEFVGAMRVGVGAEHAGDDELRLREFFPEHSHKRDGAGGDPKTVSEARVSDCSSQGDKDGACHPTAFDSGSKATRAR